MKMFYALLSDVDIINQIMNFASRSNCTFVLISIDKVRVK